MIQFDLRICFKWVETTNSTRSRNLWIPMYASPRWIVILFLGPFLPPRPTWYHSPLLTLTQWDSWKSLHTLGKFWDFGTQKPWEVWLKHHFPLKEWGDLLGSSHWFSDSPPSGRQSSCRGHQLLRNYPITRLPSTEQRQMFPVKNRATSQNERNLPTPSMFEGLNSANWCHGGDC